MIWLGHVAFGRVRSAVSLILIFFALQAQAHRTSDSYLTFRIEGQRISGQWDIAVRDLEQLLGLDTNGDGEVTAAELLARQGEVRSFVTHNLHLTIDDANSPLHTGELLLEQFTDGPYAVVRLSLDAPDTASIVGIEYRAFFEHDPQHRGLMRLESGEMTQTAVFSPTKTTQRFRLASPTNWQQFLDFTREGVWHIWLGFDHILFLLALLLPSVLRRGPNGWEAVGTFRPVLIKVVKIVTAFTVAHSITLSLATLGLVEFPSRIVESTIAASVILAALNNLRPIFPDRGWIVAFAFGLIHGFGFASVLAELGLRRQTLALALTGFNLGVEVGQLAIAALFLPFAFALRSSWVYQQLTFRFGSAVIILLAATWMVERIWEFELLPF